ncbi:hypothetical protein RHGRI_009025 [Rhododendron griersonianum]|uniref:Uncharacterized protein n=1 Tax=Rhododendron griersonianum TaxID=479676 RepID=A0AAV6L555_9ERIC|nr:hypothetical protein RHGRI_009025 [Rhododendron griersonianum]
MEDEGGSSFQIQVYEKSVLVNRAILSPGRFILLPAKSNAAVDMENTVPEMEDQGVESYILDLLKIRHKFHIRIEDNNVRKEMGLEWMLRPKDNIEREPATTSDQLEEPQAEEVVEERWGSMGQLAVSVASRTAASSRAHLHAINNRKRGLTGENQTVLENHNEKIPGKNTYVESLRDVSCCRSEMKVPKLHDSLSWGKQKDFGLISSALSSLNEFANDGSFMNEVTRQKDDELGGSVGSPNRERKVESECEFVRQYCCSSSYPGKRTAA